MREKTDEADHLRQIIMKLGDAKRIRAEEELGMCVVTAVLK